MVATGCSKVSENAGPGGHAVGTIPGTLRYADISEPTSMNPLLRLEAVGTDLDMLIHGFFFNLDDKMQFVPELALEVPTYANGGISKDGLTITYHLRHGVKWQDGSPFTAADAVFTTKAILNDANNLQSRNGWDQLVKSNPADAPDDYTVRFHLQRIYAPAISTFFAEGGLYPVLPAHLLAKYPDLNRIPYNTHPVGLGPFKFGKWVHGDRIELEANPLYWRGPPKLKRIIYKIVASDNTILIQLKTHEIDAWFRAPSNLYPQYQPLVDQGYVMQLKPGMVYSHIDLNQKKALFNDIRVRQAINYAIDKKKLLHDVTHDVQIRAYSDQSQLSWAYEPNVVHYDYDPAKSRQLLAEAGWKPGPDGIMEKNGQKLAFNVSGVAGNSTGLATEAIVQQELKAVGVQVSIKNFPTEVYFNSYQQGGILQHGDYDAGFFAWVAGADPDDKSIYDCRNIPPAGQNSAYWCDKTIQDAEDGALSSYDQNVRKKYYSIIQKEFALQSVVIVLWFQRQIFITSPNFHGFKPAPATSSNWNSWEWTME
ncbi:MAG TPA: peptide ABC transporter substrate-binding protein [Candidatus Tumulicola sp.]|nr:peptide ABC transporter substrate-binding protein [Candidatus Tumulicola sp.]